MLLLPAANPQHQQAETRQIEFEKVVDRSAIL
jgi:hypothetical protein